MKNTISALFLCLVATSAAKAQPVNRGDLYAACIEYHNIKWKDRENSTLKHFTTSQLKQLDPYSFEAMKQRCDCTVTAAFKNLSEGTIEAYSKALNENGDGIILKNKKAAEEFKKADMMDKDIACAEKSMDASGYEKKLMELSK
ncbi:hypothetical protein OEG84_06695 [Hoeflea sp. G2-23]|uniref:Uncharacterized protein n=1 Tax=Hoeflea algicola TaxID=2983763 RepID=A0ABT3Z6R4_9HYPH|nr:hypothetical protein [Hoeflea algicola]MCY0147406.1 hypothetical protein [Hoeflea algicola]